MTETTIVSSRYSPAVVAHHCLPLGELVEDADVITIRMVKHVGWIAGFASLHKVSERFYFAHYLQAFLRNASIQNDFKTYASLHGCDLVSFQCVVARLEWCRVTSATLLGCTRRHAVVPMAAALLPF